MNMMKNPKANPDVKFKDGTQMQPTDRATYLGGLITKPACPQEESSNRINIAIATCSK